MQLPATAEQIVTPLKLDNWITAMAAYPDPQFVSYIIANGIQHGFWVGFQYNSVQCNLAKANAKSASLHPEPILAYLKEELKQGRITGPFAMSQLPGVQCNKLGVIPKSTPGEWRLILDLSFHGNTVSMTVLLETYAHYIIQQWTRQSVIS